MNGNSLTIGLDVGGTHTDAVLISETGLVARHKSNTDHGNLLRSVRSAISEIAADVEPSRIRRINLSTTLATNAIVEDKLDDVCVIVSGGPGIDPNLFRIGRLYYAVGGSINHRGSEVAPLDEETVRDISATSEREGIKLYAFVSKFSTRNPEHENRMAEAIGSHAEVITLGHRLSGQLSFPRRIVTAYFNSAVWRIYNSFADAVARVLSELGIDAAINVLKADGGTMPSPVSRSMPVESILSGPAASVMGVIALCDVRHDAVMLDIGGTTTDISLFVDGVPIIEKDGIRLRSYPTLVRALATRSIGIGGDSLLQVEGDKVTVGPIRKGPAMAAGGAEPTLIDALNVLKMVSFGDVEASEKGIALLAKKGKGLTPADFAEAALDFAMRRIHAEVEDMLNEFNNRPVYTLHEMFEGRKIIPRAIYAMGGPAESLASSIEQRFGLPVHVPSHFDVANAIGAALARTTVEIELFADTSRQRLVVPSIGVSERVDQGYTIEKAEKDARMRLSEYLRGMGIEADEKETEVVESSSFNMVEGWETVGRDIRVKCQIKPGVVRRLV